VKALAQGTLGQEEHSFQKDIGTKKKMLLPKMKRNGRRRHFGPIFFITGSMAGESLKRGLSPFLSRV